MVVSIQGRRTYLWRAVDSEGEILDLLVQPRRDKVAALRLMRKLLTKQGYAPTVLVTEDRKSTRLNSSHANISYAVFCLKKNFSGADLENLVNEAAILAARRNKKTIGRDELAEAIDRVVAGPQRKSRVISEREKIMTAYHEAGHALAARLLPNADPVYKVSIVARGMMGGYTRIVPEEDRFFWTRSQFLDRLVYALSGHVAERLVFAELSTGASNDIEQVTSLARRMVTEFGMSETLGTIQYGHKEEMVFLGREISEQRNYSEEIAVKIDQEVKRLVDEAYERATQLLTAHMAQLRGIAELLVEKETIEGAELEQFFDAPRPKPRLVGPPVTEPALVAASAQGATAG